VVGAWRVGRRRRKREYMVRSQRDAGIRSCKGLYVTTWSLNITSSAIGSP